MGTSIAFEVAQPAITASGNSSTFSQDGAVGNLVVTFDATAVSGTSPSLTIQLQGSQDGVNWYNVGSPSSAITAVSFTRLPFTNVLEPNLRLNYTVSGTSPSFSAIVYVMEA